MNRDEKRVRPAERAPYQWQDTKIFAPQDAKAGGTWIGMNDQGQVACLLNGYRQDDEIRTSKTRGEIIPAALSHHNPLQYLEQLETKEYASFHLVLIDGNQTSLHSWDGQSYVNEVLPKQEWYFLTSSSWQQDEVKSKRKNIYEEWLARGAVFSGALPQIHTQHTDEAPAHSILMSRDDACTKSVTQFEVGPSDRIVRYWPKPHQDLKDFQEIRLV